MIKSFRGNNLTELDKEVNAFLEKYGDAKVVSFQAVNSGGAVPKIIYIYIVECEKEIYVNFEELRKKPQFFSEEMQKAIKTWEECGYLDNSKSK